MVEPVKRIHIIRGYANDVLEWVNHAPNLETLSIEDSFKDSFDERRPVEPKCNLSVLRVLAINSIDVSSALKWLGACKVTTLKLRIDRGGFGDGQPGSLLDGFDPSLEHLEIETFDNRDRIYVHPKSACSSCDQAVYFNRGNHQACTILNQHLQSLTIKFYHWHSHHSIDISPSHAWATHILRTITSPDLQKVTVDFLHDPTEQYFTIIAPILIGGNPTFAKPSLKIRFLAMGTVPGSTECEALDGWNAKRPFKDKVVAAFRNLGAEHRLLSLVIADELEDPSSPI